MKTYAMLALAFLLVWMTGCVSPSPMKNFEATLQSWVGKPVSELLAQTHSEKIRIHVSSEVKNGLTIYTLRTFTHYRGINPGRRDYLLCCDRIFSTGPDGRILSARWEGNGCW